MAKKRKPKKEDEEQSRRFVETARELAGDMTSEEFEKVLESLRQDKSTSRPPPADED